jgi:hypothetical protein
MVGLSYLCFVLIHYLKYSLRALCLSLILFSSQDFLGQSTKTIKYLDSDNFTPSGYDNLTVKLKSDRNETKLLKSYGYLIAGNLSGFKGAIDELMLANVSFRTDPSLDYFYHWQLSNYHLIKGQFLSAKKEALASNAIASKQREKSWQARIFAQLGKIYSLDNKKDSSQIYHKRSIEFAKRTEGNILLAMCLHEFASSNARFSQIEQAVEQELLALEIVQKINNNYLTSVYYQFIAKLSLDAGNIKESENYLIKSNQRNKIARNILLTLENNILLARLELKKEIPSQVMATLPQTILSLEKLKAEIALGEAWKVQGQALSAQKRSDEAMQSYTKALYFFENQILPKQMAEVYHLIGLNELHDNDLLNAEKNLFRSINIQKNINDKAGIFENYYALSDVFTRQGNFQKAQNYLKLYTDFLKKTTFSIDSKAIEELTQTNSREERERLINSQDEKLSKQLKEKEILQLQSDRQLLGIVIVIVVFFLSGVILFFVNRARNTLREQRETEMQQTLLRSQMNPHFIFNALSVIQSYVFENTPEKTSSFLVNFSRLIRLILENSPKEFITIDIEYEILSKYLTTQKLRFEDRFNFEFYIDEDLLSRRALIPPMITQPFVENSIEHGQLHTIKDGVIKIQIIEKDKMLEITVTDNGVGREKAAQIKKNQNHKSMAMDITRERIKIMNKKYKGRGSMEVTDLNQKLKTGTKVIICLPLIYENTIFDKNEKSINH